MGHHASYQSQAVLRQPAAHCPVCDVQLAPGFIQEDHENTVTALIALGQLSQMQVFQVHEDPLMPAIEWAENEYGAVVEHEFDGGPDFDNQIDAHLKARSNTTVRKSTEWPPEAEDHRFDTIEGVTPPGLAVEEQWVDRDAAGYDQVLSRGYGPNCYPEIIRDHNGRAIDVG